MSSSETPSSPPSSRKIPIIPLVLIALLIGFAIFGEKGVLRALQYTRQMEALEAEIQRQTEAGAELRREIEALRNDLKTIEGIARRELGMVKEGELVYQFRSRPSNPNSHVASPLATSDDVSQR
jgi:cell division protein FtsB